MNIHRSTNEAKEHTYTHIQRRAHFFAQKFLTKSKQNY